MPDLLLTVTRSPGPPVPHHVVTRIIRRLGSVRRGGGPLVGPRLKGPGVQHTMSRGRLPFRPGDREGRVALRLAAAGRPVVITGRSHTRRSRLEADIKPAAVDAPLRARLTSGSTAGCSGRASSRSRRSAVDKILFTNGRPDRPHHWPTGDKRGQAELDHRVPCAPCSSPPLRQFWASKYALCAPGRQRARRDRDVNILLEWALGGLPGCPRTR